MTENPELAVVVLSYRNEGTIRTAVESLLSQEEPAEIVVSHSGGGELPKLLEREYPTVGVISSAERRLPGAARNAGVEATRAPYVGFLAGDCEAAPGWIGDRLARHRAGAGAVASAVAPVGSSAAALASYSLLHGARAPEGPRPADHRLGGVSYSRDLLERFGPFSEKLSIGEDSELNQGLIKAGVEIAWAPEVLTLHRYPMSIRDLLRDQWTRGARTAVARPGGWRRYHLARWGSRAAADSLRRSLRTGSPVPRRRLPQVGPLIGLGAVARDAGTALSGRRPSDLALQGALRVPIPSWGLRRPSRRTRLLGIVHVRDEMEELPELLRNVAPHVDGIVAYDDGSSDGSGDYLAAHPKVLEVLRAPPDRSGWEPGRVKRDLVHAAVRHRAEWILYLIADVRVEADFRDRAERVIARGSRLGFGAYSVKLRELWDSEDQYRSDGIWGRKRRAWLFRAREDHEFDRRELHATEAPMQAKVNLWFPRADLLVYHLGMIRRDDREARRRRYETLDPDRRWQKIGYAYLTDEDGLELTPVNRRRDYVERN